METEFRLTGRHVFAMLAGFFLCIFTANAIFLNFALKTFPGEQEEKSYLQGLNYNDRLALRAQQAALGWRVAIKQAALTGDQLQVRIAITDEYGAVMPDLDVSGLISRPANAAQDYAVVFRHMGDGEYEAFSPAAAGIWDLDGKAVNSRDEEFDFSSRLILQ